MADVGKIKPGQRRLLDATRRDAVATANAWANTLARRRAEEVKRILRELRGFDEVRAWEMYFDEHLLEPYLPQWYNGLITTTALPNIAVTAKQLTGKGKALDPNIFTHSLNDFAERRAGSQITIVRGTFKDNIKATIRREIEADANIGIERLARAIADDCNEVLLWQARRIAQTEAMVALGEAGDEAARVLDIPFTKTWCCSGLSNSRESHLAMDGVVVDQYEPFVFDDCEMQYPHDPNGTAGQVINCACSCIRDPK